MRLDRTVEELRDYVGTLSTIALVTARWTIDVPELELKILLGRHVYEDLVNVERLRVRLAELGDDIDPRFHRASIHARELAQASHVTSSAQKFCWMYEVVKRNLYVRVARHRLQTEAFVDEPTAELLEGLQRDLNRQIDTARFASTNHPLVLGNGESSLSATSLSAAVSSSLAIDLRTPELPARDSRFRPNAPPARIEPHQAPGEFLPALMHSNLVELEVPSIEACCRHVLDFHQQMPWQFVLDMARQCRDEARHAEAFLRHGLRLGVRPGDFASNLTLWAMATGEPLEVRLSVHQRIGERNGVDGALWFAAKFDAVGDRDTAALFEFVAQDEIMHVAYGTKWIRYITGSDQGVQDALNRALKKRSDFGKASEGKLTFPLNVAANLRAGLEPSEVEVLSGRFHLHGSVFPELVSQDSSHGE